MSGMHISLKFNTFLKALHWHAYVRTGSMTSRIN